MDLVCRQAHRLPLNPLLDGFVLLCRQAVVAVNIIGVAACIPGSASAVIKQANARL
jgi:hypothetical protein